MKRNVLVNLLVSIVLLMPIGSLGAPTALTGPQATGAQTAQHSLAPQAPLDVPTLLVPSGVSDYIIADPKVFWYYLPFCAPTSLNAPTSLKAPTSVQSPTADPFETISRIATYGGITRTLFSYPVNYYCPSYPDVASNIVSDGSYLYWTSYSQNGIVKLSVDASAGITPTLFSTAVSGSSELALAQGELFALTEPYNANGALWDINLTTGAGTQLEANAGMSPAGLQTDNAYLYWFVGSSLVEWDVHYQSSNGTIASGVTGYHPAGQVVFYGQGQSLRMYSNIDNTDTLLYTSADTTARVYSIVYDGTNLFWFEDHTLDCAPQPCFPPHDDVLFRAGTDGSNPTQIYLFNAGLMGPDSNLQGDGNYLFWQENGGIQRLPKNASALPDINMHATGLEVTQGIQDLNNDVQLIQDRNTFVRFYVQSDGAAVPGVSAFLYRTDAGGAVIDGPLVPVNPVGQQITVQPAPDRNNLNDSFLFELPYSWTDSGALYLKAVMNPYEDPLEPNYGDNTWTSGALNFQSSPRLVVYFVSWGYSLNNQTYYPRLIKDVIQTFSWIRRAYPLASAPGMLSDPTPGFRPNLWTIFDSGLGARVNQTAPGCTDNLCASAYTNQLMDAMRTENNIPNNIFMYGMISDAAGIFPRGQACCGTNVSSGPAGSGTWGWDYDGSYADWYAGHEIGHTLGRAHPTSSAALCGNSASDNSYPYPNGQIGPSNGILEGFDVGDGSLGLPLAVYPGATWHDVMTYCNNQWISDYTYNGMYNFMTTHPLNALQSNALSSPSISGDWLAVYGHVISGANTADLTRVRHLSTVATIPPLVAGPYSIELFNASNTMLASYPFTPQPPTDDQPTWLNFTQVVTYAVGTSEVRIVRLADSHTLATMSVPAHAPTISNVALQGAPNPVTGTVTLNWTANDVDDNPLTFDIFYSRDGGATVRPFMLGVTGNSASIDTTQLGGSGQALLRVVATDGVNTAQADSAQFTMANKPPQPMILTPGDNTHTHYGQLVNLSGQALDYQDGSVSDANLVWTDQAGSLGTGPLLSVSNLPVGVNVITLTATNSSGLSAKTSITIVVDDNLNLPGPTLSAGPTQFAWSFASNTAPSQNGTLKLDNAGGGTLTWKASTDAPWLQLSATQGTVPFTMTLTANPAGLGNDTAHSGHVIFTAPASGGQPTQTLSIPVSLAVGGSASNPPFWAAKIYLPIIAR